MYKLDPSFNYGFSIENGILSIEIVIDEARIEPLFSATGKCLLLAFTDAPTQIPGTCLKMNLTVFRKF